MSVPHVADDDGCLSHFPAQHPFGVANAAATSPQGKYSGDFGAIWKRSFADGDQGFMLTARTDTGKTTSQTDTFHGRFVTLVPDVKVVEAVEFETDDPTLKGEMTITYMLADSNDGTDLVGVHEHLPPGVPPADNELGWRMSIDKLAKLVETDR